MKTALARTLVGIGALSSTLACAAGMPLRRPDLALLTTVVCLLGGAGALCLLLRRLIEADDRVRELGSRLQREEAARQRAEAILAETQTVLSRLLHQQDAARDGERARLAGTLQQELGRMLLALRADLSLLHVSSNGMHPLAHQKAGHMILTLDQALGALRGAVEELRALPAGPTLATPG